jgi:predicted TIM-barrel fold metal-dependent hydrolase
MTADRWMTEFAELPFKPESRQKILLDNARALFGI